MRELAGSLASFVLGIFTGFVAYLFVAWPREVLRKAFSNRFCESVGIRATQVLNPIRYVDPIGLLTFLLFEFGWTRMPFVDYPKSKRRDLIVYSLLGIASSFVLFVAYAFVARTLKSGVAYQLFYKAAKWSLTYAFISLIPLPPLDSSRIILGLLPSRYYEWYLKFNIFGTLFMLGLLLLWIFPMMMRPFVMLISNVTNFIVSGHW